MIIFNLCRVLPLLQAVIKPQPAHEIAHLAMSDLMIVPSSSLNLCNIIDINGLYSIDLQLYVPGSAQSQNKVANTVAIDPLYAKVNYYNYFSAPQKISACIQLTCV